MKKNSGLIAVISILLICVVTYFENKVGIDPDVSFSADSGFYEESFLLEIYSRDNNSIYYTLDGSLPTQSSEKYDGPILIEDVSSCENVYSARTDVSARFMAETDENYTTAGAYTGYVVPNYPVDKCNIIRAVSYDDDGNATELVERVYFVGYQNKSEYDNLYVVSITTAPDNLFGYENGIYVTGKTFDEFVAQTTIDSGEGWGVWYTNFLQRGREWEREATIDIFDENRNNILSQRVGIRIGGSGSRAYAQKSFNIYAREEYSGCDTLQADLFGTGYEADKIKLFSGGDDNISKIKDYFSSHFAEELNVCTMNMIPCVLFLNGEFWGVYYISESFSEGYFDYYYYINDVFSVKNEVEELGGPRGALLYNDLNSLAHDLDLSLDENYEKVQQLVDIENLIDIYAFEIYLARHGDWPSSNYMGWRSVDISDEEYGDNRWRWGLMDMNSFRPMEEMTLEHNTINRVATGNQSYLFGALLENENFRKQFCIRIMDNGNILLTPENTIAFIDEYEELMSGAMELDHRRFYGDDREIDFAESMDSTRVFFEERLLIQLEQINEEFGFENEITTVNLSVEGCPETESIIKVNTMYPNLSGGTWTGVYIREYPMTFEAEEIEGYEFVGWLLENGNLITENSMEIELAEEEIFIQAIYEKEE